MDLTVTSYAISLNLSLNAGEKMFVMLDATNENAVSMRSKLHMICGRVQQPLRLLRRQSGWVLVGCASGAGSLPLSDQSVHLEESALFVRSTTSPRFHD